MKLLEGKVALITGAARGIGKSIAVKFAQEGAKVVAADINDAAGEAVVAEIKAQGGEALYVHADISKAAATRAVDTVISSITNTLKNGDQVTLVGFGTFQVRPRAARQGRNPRTGEPISIPASNNPAFKAGKALKDAVN